MTHSPRERLLLVAAVLGGLAILAGTVPAQENAGNFKVPLRDYHNGSDYLPETPSVTGGAVSAFFNPAAWATGDRTEFAFWWNSRNVRDNALDDWGLSLGKHLGLAVSSDVYRADGATRRVTDTQLGLALGGRSRSVGLAYRWASGDTEDIGRHDALVLGAIARPSAWYAFGASGAFAAGSSANQGVFDLGIRPLGTDVLTFFGDYTLNQRQKLSEGRWGAGFYIRPLTGLHLGVKFREADLVDDEEYRVTYNLGIVLGATSFNFQPTYSEGGERLHNDYLVRLNPSLPPLPISLKGLARSPRYVSVNLDGKYLTYQKYRYGDHERVAWLDLSRYLDAIAADDDVDGIVLNLAGFNARPSLAWELRQKLLALQHKGLEIVIHGDRLGMLTYYLASLADQLSLDPQGMVMLPGVSLQRTYLKGTLEKIGIGFQELRYFEYKSAAEMLSRQDMSAADREQRQRVVDVIYETLRAGASEGRDLGLDRYEAFVADKVVVTANMARDLGLVDRVGRWQDISAWLKEQRGGKLVGGPSERYLRDYHDLVWGRPPRIVVVYAVGECAMDTGIKGRVTSTYLQQLARAHDVAAVVLRVDSPGGDPLPSDLVAAGVRKLRAAGKPVVVSQGDVAASGGYWISMDGTRILTTPLTLTGSIGVIGGWYWDDGLGEKLGMTTDGVQRGKHADLFAGLRFPLLGSSLPRRPLDEEEQDRAESLIRELYDDFVMRVAMGRNLSETSVREVGEGRIWMGQDALERGLCDSFGTLPDAIAQARELAGIPAKRKVAVVEFPHRPFFDWGNLGPRVPGLGLAGTAAALLQPIADLLAGSSSGDAVLGAAGDGPGSSDYEQVYLQTLAEHMGSPLLLTPPDLLPSGWTAESP